MVNKRLISKTNSFKGAKPIKLSLLTLKLFHKIPYEKVGQIQQTNQDLRNVTMYPFAWTDQPSSFHELSLYVLNSFHPMWSPGTHITRKTRQDTNGHNGPYGVIFWMVIFLIVLFANSCKNSTYDALVNNISARLAMEEGFFAVAFKDLQTDEMVLVQEDTNFHAASTMKTPVMIEVFKQVAQGTLSLEDSILVTNSFASIVDGSPYEMSVDEDSEGELYDRIGEKTTLYRLVYDMITTSSNLATNIVIELVDAKRVTQTMRDLGAQNIQVLRGVEDIKAYELGLSNTTTAKDLLIIFENLAKGTAVSEEADRQMVQILKEQVWRDVIPALLPDDVVVANKTGSITGVHHDSGIVFLPDGRKYILVLLSKNLDDFERGTQALAEVSRMIYQYMEKKG